MAFILFPASFFWFLSEVLIHFFAEKFVYFRFSSFICMSLIQLLTFKMFVAYRENSYSKLKWTKNGVLS